MTREERLKNKAIALEALLQSELLIVDRLYYENQLSKLQTSAIVPVAKTINQLLEDYNIGLDSCRWTEREMRKSGISSASLLMLESILENLKQYLEKVRNEFYSIANANQWLPETRAEKILIRDRLFELDMEHESLVILLELQRLQLERQEKTDFLTQQVQQNQLKLEQMNRTIKNLQIALHS